MNDSDDREPKQTFLNTQQAADWLGLKPNTLAKMRVAGSGPAFRKHGQRVLYHIDDLTAWSDSRRRLSTSEIPDE